MQRKFKLLKKYPGLPDNAYQAIQTGTAIMDFRLTTEKDDCHFGYISLSTLEKYTEYWQEIKENTYEILNFIGIIASNKNCLFSLRTNGKYAYAPWQDSMAISKEAMLIGDLVKINSVKRIADGEIFTLGDNTTLGIITEIEINKNCRYSEIQLTFQNTIADLYCPNSNDKSKFLVKKKEKEPLLITEDGIPLYHNDRYYFLNTNTYVLSDLSYLIGKHSDEYTNIKYGKYFSTLESANEYIIKNKPCLSLREIFNCSTISELGQSILYDKVKQKLNM